MALKERRRRDGGAVSQVNTWEACMSMAGVHGNHDKIEGMATRQGQRQDMRIMALAPSLCGRRLVLWAGVR